MKAKMLPILFLLLFTVNILAQPAGTVSNDGYSWNAERLKQFAGENNLNASRIEITLLDKRKLRGFIHEIREDGFRLINPETGLADYVIYSQLAQIKPAPPIAEFSKLQEKPSLETYWKNFFTRTINNSAIGYSYAIYQNGAPIAVSSYGYDQFPRFPKDSGVPMSPQTRVQLASVSKPITAIALLRVMAKKGISLDTKFWTILQPQFPDITPGRGVEDITIAQLLSHTSGYGFGYVETPRLKNMRELLMKPVPYPSGEKYIYSNINFSIARTLLETLTNQNYEDYVREEILRPAGAEGISLRIVANKASFAYQPGDFTGAPIITDFRNEGGAYGWYANAEEAARVFGLVKSNNYLSPEMTKTMFDRHLGWGTSQTPAGTAYQHDGEWIIENSRGVRTGIALLPDNITAVLLINTDTNISPGEILARGFSENIPRIKASNLDKTKRLVRVELPIFTDEIYCTTDGSNPVLNSRKYIQPIFVEIPATVKCRGFLAGQPVTFVNTLELK